MEGRLDVPLTGTGLLEERSLLGDLVDLPGLSGRLDFSERPDRVLLSGLMDRVLSRERLGLLSRSGLHDRVSNNGADILLELLRLSESRDLPDR